MIFAYSFAAAAIATMPQAAAPQLASSAKIEIQATVTVLRAETINPIPSKQQAQQLDRQYRKRVDLRLVEFY